MPSFRPLTLTPLTVQLPPVTVAATGVVVVVPSLAVTATVAPASTEPLAVVLVSFDNRIGVVTEVMVTVGATVSFVVVNVLVLVAPLIVLVAVAVYVIVPSFRLLTLMPLTVQLPPVTVADTELVECPSVSVATTETVSPEVTVPLAVVLLALLLLIGLVTDVTETVLATVRVKAWASCREFVLSSAWATRSIVPEKPLAGVNVTIAVLPVPGVTVTWTFAGVAVNELTPVTLKSGIPPSPSVASSWKVTGVFAVVVWLTTGLRNNGGPVCEVAVGGAATTLNVCCAELPSEPWPVTVIVALPVKLFGSEICTTPFCVSLMILAEVIVTGVLA